jgi:hypothetical protein
MSLAQRLQLDAPGVDAPALESADRLCEETIRLLAALQNGLRSRERLA